MCSVCSIRSQRRAAEGSLDVGDNRIGVAMAEPMGLLQNPDDFHVGTVLQQRCGGYGLGLRQPLAWLLRYFRLLAVLASLQCRAPVRVRVAVPVPVRVPASVPVPEASRPALALSGWPQARASKPLDLARILEVDAPD